MIEIHGRVDEHAPVLPLRFGIFLPPMHPVGQNPTLTLQRDLQLIQHLDELGYDEAWIGEHHSSGFETIASRRSSSPPPPSARRTSSSAPASTRCRTTTR
jgi:alkanesulfonate monooxygenase SsuD/methylene tetrahydromethanopterin reductase-like flavin-dependent oxidoreductase (luciferase family)